LQTKFSSLGSDMDGCVICLKYNMQDL